MATAYAVSSSRDPPSHDGPSASPSPNLPVDATRCSTDDKYDEVQERNKSNMRAVSLEVAQDRPAFWGIDKRKNLTWYSKSKLVPPVDFEQACNAWDDVCGVAFREVSERKAFIIVRDATEKEEMDQGIYGVVATSFFPGEAVREIVFYRAYSRFFNRIGVLIHQLGHALGFRHDEHPWKTVAQDEDADPQRPDALVLWDLNKHAWSVQQLMGVDEDSVMHYGRLWRDERAQVQSSLSDLDKAGAQYIYGQSSKDVDWV
eukprot:TRINITY_DN1086_c0_g1_i2.p1 TRINITY_DN1086_c0_g1~~TRINITY_DN1086_c0_g1_i2.p1  ORF type:complete len:259 (-),score=53.85 TRINITY_DN1086_c0_g1_i2:212-988(-)